MKKICNPTTFLRRSKWWYLGALTGSVDLLPSLASPLSRCVCLPPVHKSVSLCCFGLKETRATARPGVFFRSQFRSSGQTPSVVEPMSYLNKYLIDKNTIFHYTMANSDIHYISWILQNSCPILSLQIYPNIISTLVT